MFHSKVNSQLKRLQEGHTLAAVEVYQRNFHTARKDIGLMATTGIENTELVLSRGWCWDTLFVAHWQHYTSHYTVGVELPKFKVLTHVTDKAEIYFASLLPEDF